ncbi:MAG: GntR family transcriptional regulator [Butyrivibrio sp.]|nr:GntR family transcriptional regulator [Butyrivibrio sp.]
MVFTIDFNSNEAIYMQLCNQIILGIANAEYRDGDSLPSVRQMAEIIGINMHTVNKAYSVLRQEGYIKLDRRHGAVISLDADRILALEAMNEELKVVIAKAISKNITPEEIHAIVDEIIARFTEG